MANDLQVRLVFWKQEHHARLDATKTLKLLGEVVTGLCGSDIPHWQVEDCTLLAEVDMEGVKFCVTIKHTEFNDVDIRKEEAVLDLCQHLYLERSTETLSLVLANGNLVVGPYSETSSMTAVDYIFNRCYTLEHLNQLLNCVEGKPKWFHRRKPEKYFLGPLYLAESVTNFVKSINPILETFETVPINQLAKAMDVGNGDLSKTLHEFQSYAKVVSRASPIINTEIRKWVDTPDKAGDKAKLLATLNPFTRGGNMLIAMMKDLGDKDPSMIQSRQIFSTLMHMVASCESLQTASLNHTGSCKAETSKGIALAVAGIAVSGVSITLFPPAAAPMVLGPLVGYFSGVVAASVGVGLTTHHGMGLHQSKKVKWSIRQLYIALLSCKCFLYLVIINSYAALVKNSVQYEQVKKMLQENCNADLDCFDEPGYANLAVAQMVRTINSTVADMKMEIEALT